MNEHKSYEIEHKKIDYLFMNQKNGLLGLTGLILFVFIIYYSHVESTKLYIWVMISVIILVIRASLLISYMRVKLNEVNIKRYYYLFVLFASFSAFSWGSGAFLIFPDSGKYQIILLLLTGGVMSASVIVLASKVKLFYIYTFFILTPYLYILFISDIEMYHIFGYIMLFFTVIVISIFKKTSKSIGDNIIFQYENCELIKKLEEKVIDADSANRAKSEFLSVMSHEIRTPLNAIIGFVKILKENENDDKKKKYLNVIDQSSNILINVINDILDISKIEANKLTLEKTMFQPKEEFSTLSMLFEKSAEEKGVKLVNSISDGLPRCIESDILRLKQVISNLLSNAIKFTPRDGEVALIISFDTKKELLKIEVKDSGIGIADKDIAKVTDSFTQADSSTARKYGGSGLGLSIVTAILKLFGSELIIKSELEKGSSFSFSLKIDVIDIPEGMEESENSEDLNFEGKKVLVAEDNKTNQMLVEILLDDMNLEIVMANDGVEAVNSIKECCFDIVLMDINMPNKNGVTAMQEIKMYEVDREIKHVPIVALTANAVSGDREKYMKLGFDDYLAKPIDVSLLEKVLERNIS
jgi:signal transduction histidine kinase/CheY-like chemotaxis protein